MRLYSVSSRFVRVREAYYAQLEALSRGDLDITPWLLWMCREVEQAATKSVLVTDRVSSKARFWSRHGRSGLNERQRKVMNRLLDAGRDGFDGGMSNAKYVRLTGASAHRAARPRRAGLARLPRAQRARAFGVVTMRSPPMESVAR